MCKQEVFTASKAVASSFPTLVDRDVPDVNCRIKYRDYLPFKDGGYCIEYELARGCQRVSVVVFLGDPVSPDGPFNGNCWLIVGSRGWFKWLYGNGLYSDVCKAVLQSGAYVSAFGMPVNTVQESRPDIVAPYTDLPDGKRR